MPAAALQPAGVSGGGAVGLGQSWLKARSATLLDGLVIFWVLTGAMVITEPSPYEFSFLLVLGMSLLGGFGLYRSTLGLLALFVGFIPFAIIAAFQVKFSTVSDALIYQIVTIFLLFTAYWVANYVAEAPQERMKKIMLAYTIAAVFSAVAGTLGYLGIGHELFTRYDRAKALFKDPNVYGPFLILPAMYALQRVLLLAGRPALIAAAIYGVLLVGVFASFSRAAWGHVAISSLMVFVLVFALEAKARAKVRMLLLSLMGAAMLLVSFAGLMSVPQFRDFFELRTQEQNYDTGESGRFGRQGYAFGLALDNPLGLGPLEFRNLRIKEEPHNSYVNVLHAYGWGGGLAFILFILTTLWRGASFVLQPGPNRLLLIPLVSVFVPLAAEAAIIDMDHWRHFFLVAGLIWGVTAAYRKAGAAAGPI